ncbi:MULTISPECIES: tRNA (cytidine(34)-2'-O)-methyltransferase [Clostridia]|uniref:Putative tRNA (cytidine(34)-2'-O)-methyltransferase n=2 Tax=Clostridia TaxID=186801 RepID=A0A8I0A8G0_9CLOT|nr:MULTISPECIES: tRNA (cytidine(34)-2'-O)-methyltransferase [Clostridia]MBC5640112.1 tRNA (cytidine(34)-2'-O)-methyltransferase [Clostridium lentum]MBC5654330.1 tRNA (cytidine(34)-2'-O)-methyltransferase [Blautia lenta]MEE0566486.1 tRNA (cytidine(34)-2'-O)-methyltransferase [Clostridium sp.]OKZ88118.1 MAG: tRNA (uridine(34)/cytosine(34)/5-carboxymethylaminomethyluridine(34)-2'-O)-methyltransferase TrmL [Clostridium sp. 29_15]CDB74666.1 putative tRNA (cytidine(34)-2'-O)-methyltransferase [Clost
MNLNIVLYKPEIPQNTGNIARTCVLTDSVLHLIKPLGFSIDDKAVKRSGLDYWKDLKLEVHESYEDFMAKYGEQRIFLATTHGGKFYNEESYKPGDFIMFGKESSGVPEEVHNAHKGIRIPMIKTSTRSLNLSNTVCTIAYEALRQMDFPNMK